MILIAEVRAAGGTLRLQGSDLVVSKVPPELLDRLKRHKAEIVRALRAEAMGVWDWTSHPCYILLDEIADTISRLPESAVPGAHKTVIVTALRDAHILAYDKRYWDDGLPQLPETIVAVLAIAKSCRELAVEGPALVSLARRVLGAGRVDASAFA